jgi:hypothetical protein
MFLDNHGLRRKAKYWRRRRVPLSPINYRLKRFSIQIDSRTTHLEPRQAKRLFRFWSCSGGQTFRNELVDKIRHRPSLNSGQIFQAHHLSVFEEQRRPSHTGTCILVADICQSGGAFSVQQNGP